MPSLLHFEIETQSPRPRGWLGIPVHGIVFSAIEKASAKLSKTVHESPIKPFRVAHVHMQENRLEFSVGVLADELTPLLLEALAPSTPIGNPEDTFVGTVREAYQKRATSYNDLYQQHLAQNSQGRHISWDFLSPVTFHQGGMDNPFPVPRLIYWGLAQRFLQFSGLNLGEHLDAWVERSVRVQDYKIFPRKVYFKGNHESTLTGSVGKVELFIAKPGIIEPQMVRMLSHYALFAGVGYKTTYGLGHAVASGWRLQEEAQDVNFEISGV